MLKELYTNSLLIIRGVDKTFYIYHIVDCELSNWTQWSSCKPCGIESRSRNRTILVCPMWPKCGQCGPTFEIDDCAENPCTGSKIL